MKNFILFIPLLLSFACSSSIQRRTSTPLEFEPEPITHVRAPLSIAFVREHINSNAGLTRLSEDGFDTSRTASKISEISPVGIAPIETIVYPKQESQDDTWGISHPYVNAPKVERTEFEQRFEMCQYKITLIQLQCNRIYSSDSKMCQNNNELYKRAREECNKILVPTLVQNVVGF